MFSQVRRIFFERVYDKSLKITDFSIALFVPSSKTFLANTCSIPPITNGYISGCSSSQVPFEHTCQFHCNFGYEATDGRGTVVHRTCQKDGTWSGQDLHCGGKCYLSISLCSLLQRPFTKFQSSPQPSPCFQSQDI